MEKNVTSFYIGSRNSYVEKYFALIEDWIKTKDQTGEDVYIGEIEYRPFAQQGNRDNKYRLLVKKKLRKDGQLNMFTNES